MESREVAASAATIRNAMSDLSFDGLDAIVLVSPHAAGTGCYGEITGTLDAFGVSGVEVRAETTVVPGLGRLDGPVDHGVVVPLRIMSWNGPVGPVGFDDDALDLGDVVTVQRAIESLTERVAVVASVNLSAGLSARAPLAQVEGAHEAEETLVQMIQEDVGWLLTGARSIADVGSCGLAPLTLMARLFDGRPAKVLAHESPVGVGYLVAEVA